jgi:hypothetical protein
LLIFGFDFRNDPLAARNPYLTIQYNIILKTTDTLPLTYSNRQFSLNLPAAHKLVVLPMVRPISEIYGPGCLKSKKELIFDLTLCYHSKYKESYLSRVPKVESHNNGSKHDVETKAVKSVHHIKRHGL